MFLQLLLLPFITHSGLCNEQLNVTTDLHTEEAGAFSWEGTVSPNDTDNVTSSLQDPPAPSASLRPAQGSRGPRLARRRTRRGRRFRSGIGPRYRETPYNAYNPYYRAPQTYYDVYYNPYQGYYPEYAQPGYYPQYPYHPQQPYPQPYPQPPPPPVIPSPPPTLAPIPDLYYVQNNDGQYQYRRVSVTRRTVDSRWPQHPGYHQGPYNSYDRRPSQDHRHPRRPGRLPPSEFRPAQKLTSAPYQAQVFGVKSPPSPSTQATETSGG